MKCCKKVWKFEWSVIICKPFTLKCMCILQTWTLVHGTKVTKLVIFIPPFMFMDIEAIIGALFAFLWILERKLWKFIRFITLFIFMTMFCGTHDIMRTDNIILLVPHNIVMDLNNVMVINHEYWWDWVEFTCTKNRWKYIYI